jgi:cell division ATPase FtsA
MFQNISTKIFDLLNLNKKSPYFLTFDISSDTFKIYLNEEVNVENEFKLRVKHEFKEHVSREVSSFGKIHSFDKAKSVLDKMVLEIRDFTKGISVNEGVVILNGSNSRSIMTTLRISRNSRDEITETENNEIMQKVFETAYNEIAGIVYDETKEENVALDLLDFFPIYLSCDGREVIDLIGETGSEIEVCFSVFFGRSEEMEILKKLVKSIGINKITFISSNQALLKSLKSSKKDKVDAVILDVGSNITEVIVCFGGGVLLNKVLEIGGYDLTQELSEKLKLSFLNAEKIKRFYTYNKLKEKESDIVSKVINYNLENWLNGLIVTFEDFKSVKTFPSDFYVVGGSSELPDINEMLFEEPWTKTIPFKEIPSYKKIDFVKLKKLDKSQMSKPNEDLVPTLVSLLYLEKRANI